jgi:hypothetical protein
MLLEQTHFPVKGVDWERIIIGSLIAIATGVLVYEFTKPKKLGFISKLQEPDQKLKLTTSK